MLELLAVDAVPEVGVRFVLPGWVSLMLLACTVLGTVLTTLKLVTNAVKPIHEEVRGWMQTTDLVTQQAPKWDEGLQALAGAQSELASAVEGLADVTRVVSHVQLDIAGIREQVTLNDGDTLKDLLTRHVAESFEVWGEVGERLQRIEASGSRIEASGDRVESEQQRVEDDLDRTSGSHRHGQGHDHP